MSNSAKETVRKKEKKIAIIGGGCAGWSLAAYADKLYASQVQLYKKKEKHRSHNWGFWQMPWLSDAVSNARRKWHRWQIITNDGSAEHYSFNHPYCSLKSDDWIGWCKHKFLSAETETLIIEAPVSATNKNCLITSKHKSEFDSIYDSRPPSAEKNILLQHFRGLEIRTTRPVFNPHIAILMDFRVSQEKGIHFMYVLGYSETSALVESTFFSPSPHSDEIYENEIREYLKRVFEVEQFDITHSETGVIPMGDVKRVDTNPFLTAIGSNAAAVRPSSGYAFSFIQKQLKLFISQHKKPVSPHKAQDIWMDKVFLEVLKLNPEKAPHLFLRLAKSLNGDAFARFLSGEAKVKDYLSVIWSMPKWLFIFHAVKVILGLQKRATK